MTVGDVETAPGTLTLTAASTNTALVPVANVAFGGSGANRTVTVTPVAGQTGATTITITVSDGTGTAFDTFTVTAAAQTATTVTMPTTSLTPSTYGQAVTFTATASGAGGTPGGTMTFFDGATALGTATLNAAGLGSLTTTMVAVGTRSITAVYNGNSQYAGSTSPARTQTVNAAATTSTLTISATSLQYSDRMTYEVTVTGANGAAPAQGVNFTIAMQTMNAAPVPFVNMGGGTWKATYANVPVLETVAGQMLPNGATKTVTATYSGPSANYTLPVPTAKAVILNKEDVRVDFVEMLPVSTGGDGTETIQLKVKVKDIARTVDAAGDTTVGDIRLARVTILNRAGGVIGANLPVTIDPDDPSGLDGVATVNWTANIGTNLTQTFTFGFIVSNYYTRNSTLDDATLTVVR